MNIPETGWTLIHRVKILPTVKYMLLAFFTQTLLYTLLFVVLYRYGVPPFRRNSGRWTTSCGKSKS